MDTEHLLAQSAARIDQHRGRGALHRVRPHRERDGVSVQPGHIDTDGEPNAVLMKERAQGLDPHGFVVLEHRVQPDDRERCVGEQLGNALGLGQAARDAAGAQHLEGVEQHHPPPKALKAERLGGVEPRRRLPFRGGPRLHQKSPSFTYGGPQSVTWRRHGLTHAAAAVIKKKLVTYLIAHS